jgi:serine/threonine protein kinase
MITLPKGTIIDSIHILDSVGSGGSGQVYVGQDEINKQFYAVKSINTTDRGAIRLEAGLHSRVKEHPNVVNLERIIRTTDGATHFVLEYSPEGDLYSAITERDLYCGDHTLIRNTFLQLIDAVSYCHERGVYHRDLKPDNILVFDHGKTIKLADFGLATTDIVSQDYGCGSTIYFSPGKYIYK